MKRTAKHIDWHATAGQRVTRELAMRGVSEMPIDVITGRVIGALHEAAHFVVAVRNKVSVFNVAILGLNGRFRYIGPASGDCWGECRTYYDDELPYAHVALAGAAFQSLLFGQGSKDTPAFIDFFEALRVLAFMAISSGSTEGVGPVHAEAWCIHGELRAFLVQNWHLVERVAVALLMYSNATGTLNREKTAELYSAVRRTVLPSEIRHPSDTFAALDEEIITCAETQLNIPDEAEMLKKWQSIYRRCGAEAQLKKLAGMAA